jgi:hypothetical protein
MAISSIAGPKPVLLYKGSHPLLFFPISCARACTVASEVFTEAQSFADCKLHIRTRLSAPAFSNFWKKKTTKLDLVFFPVMVHLRLRASFFSY